MVYFKFNGVLILYVILSECAVDLVPKSWMKDKKIANYVKTKKRLPIRDASYHQHLLKYLDRDQRHDRPDILHFGLLTAMGYHKKIKNLKIQFSTLFGSYSLNNDTRLPRSQIRFYGLLETLFQNTYSGNLINKIQDDVLESNEPKIIFSKYGTPIEQLDLKTHKIFIFGGFSSGSFQKNYSNSIEVSLSNESLELWTAISLFFHYYLLNSEIH